LSGDSRSVRGKTIVITGATSGIGEVAANRLAEQGARIVFVARDRKRAEATLKRLPGAGHAFHLADLSTLAEMKRVGAEIAAQNETIDVLMNNAGALFSSRRMTADGLEMTFAVNHMAYFMLTNALRERLKAGARIVNTASAAHRGADLDFNDLHFVRGYSSWAAYGRSKLCNILFSRALAKRLAGSSVTANCLHPGFVATRFGSDSGFLARSALSAAKLTAISPEEGAKTMLYLATSPEVANVSGAYFNRCAPETPSAAAQDDAAAERLWEVSAKIAGLAP
jgi:NAD(P)-dependent dehydrogenase (short-subunit alcohol dehydrogenase family)